MLEQAEENTEERAQASLADGGYHSGVNLKACSQRWTVLMPESQERALKNPYHKDRFVYDESTDSYTCPQGQVLNFRRVKRKKGSLAREYGISLSTCLKCSAFGTCTQNDKYGRRIEVGTHDELLRQHRALKATEAAKDMYSRRKELPEPTFGILKEQMGMRRFLLRGLANVKAELLTLVTALNLRTLWRFWRKRKLIILN